MKRVLLLASLAAVGARADVVSRFDTDREGWVAADVNPLTLGINSTNTDIWRDGHLAADEFGNGLFVFAAPTAYLGDKSAYYGGTVSFTLSDTVNDGSPYIDLLLRGNGFAMAYVTPPPSTSGTSYTVPLTEAGWIGFDGNPVSKAQFQSALASLDRFGVNADWKTAGQDSATLDDVVLANPVPEPASLAALALGVGALGIRRKTIRRY